MLHEMLAARRPNYEAQIVAERRVRTLLHKVAKALDEAGAPYAVVGGNAVAAWVMTVDEAAVRATKDVDISIRRKDYQTVAAALRQIGLVPVEVLGVTMFVDRRRPNPKTGVHIVFAQECVRAQEVDGIHITAEGTLTGQPPIRPRQGSTYDDLRR